MDFVWCRALTLMVIAACGRVGFDDVVGTGPGADGRLAGDGPGGTDASSDAASSDGASGSGCLPPPSPSTFPGGLPCIDWGASLSTLNGSATESAGTLSMTPNPNASGAQVKCTLGSVAFEDPGLILEVSQVLAGANAIVGMQYDPGGTVASMMVHDGMLTLTAGGNIQSVTYVPQTMRFWRMRPTLPTGIAFDVSDGGPFQLLGGNTSDTYAASAPMVILAGTPTAVAAPRSAQLESVNLCPP